MLAELVARARQAWARVRAAAGDDVVGRLSELRELALDESAQLEQDGAALAQRIRRNTQRNRQVFGGGGES